MNYKDLYRKTFGKDGFLKKSQFDEHKMQIKDKGCDGCQYTGKPQYNCRVAMPNDFNLKSLYSVPCGQEISKRRFCTNWIFLDVPERENEDEWVTDHLRRLGWKRVKGKHRRFICPCHKRR